METTYSFVGRQHQANTMLRLLETNRSEMLALIGRRRVGKTELVWQTLGSRFDFEMTGIQHATNRAQLKNFANKYNQYAKPPIPIDVPRNWQDAFQLLKHWLSKRRSKKKIVLFFDEIPWIATKRSNFLELIGHFWNDWAVRNNVLLIICGSAASWMIKQVVHHKGSLHNRITQQIHLKPFTLAETEQMLLKKGIQLERIQVALLYMVTGGIPFYLTPLEKGKSVPQYIDELCFKTGGVLTNEFEKLFSSLYEKPDNHVEVIKALATKWSGMTRAELVTASKLADGGTFTKVLEELETSDFISSSAPFDKKKKDTLYRLTDPFCLFYLKFMMNLKKNQVQSFEQIAQSQAFKSWTGYAFENLCYYHLPQLKQALGISGVSTAVSGYLFKGNVEQKGLQVDMVLDRADGIIHLCEMKFYQAPFTLTKAYADELRERKVHFKELTGTRKSVYLLFLSPFGLSENPYKFLPEHQFDLQYLFTDIPVD
ncbi:MAG: ATP-binding protein [Chitinophagaceae bacterium]|nr:ATP-binding protein [Chitinophagaceae bacterium]